ncbi:MAG: hypothetical protein ACM359_03300 [Bacillota bacterium]
MVTMRDVSEAQRRFLKAFGEGKVAVGDAAWPKPMRLNRWLRSKRFQQLYAERASALKREIRLHLLERTLAAARQVGQQSTNEQAKDQHRDFLQMIKLWMACEKAVENPKDKGEKTEEDAATTFEEAALQLANPNAPAGEVIAFFRKRAAEKES